LPNLTAEDLKDLGVSIVGHRRKLLYAIAALRNDGSSQPQIVPAAPARPSAETPSAAPVAEPVGERRQVTVMLSDLVGSQASPPAWTLKTSAKSFRLTRGALQRPCNASPAS